MKKNKILFLTIWLITFICIDQVVKLIISLNFTNNQINIIENFFKITYVQNTGGAFGIGANSTFIFIITSVLILGIIIKFLIFRFEQLDRRIIISLNLVLAGGFGNLIDRLFRGYVIDYFSILNFPVFNIADIYIVVGAIIFGICVIIYRDLKI